MSTILSITEILAVAAAVWFAARWEANRRAEFAAEAACGMAPSGRPLSIWKTVLFGGFGLIVLTAADISWTTVSLATAPGVVMWLWSASSRAAAMRRAADVTGRVPVWFSRVAGNVAARYRGGLALCGEESDDYVTSLKRIAARASAMRDADDLAQLCHEPKAVETWLAMNS
jgi:hypothetical protein